MRSPRCGRYRHCTYKTPLVQSAEPERGQIDQWFRGGAGILSSRCVFIPSETGQKYVGARQFKA